MSRLVLDKPHLFKNELGLKSKPIAMTKWVRLRNADMTSTWQLLRDDSGRKPLKQSLGSSLQKQTFNSIFPAVTPFFSFFFFLFQTTFFVLN